MISRWGIRSEGELGAVQFKFANFNGGSGDIIQPNGAVHFILGNSKRGGVRVIANPTVPFSLQISMEDIQPNGAVHFSWGIRSEGELG